ncbi:MAG: antibiotic biosynthesis monooxygenase [Prevotellaceae bacterium]|jgi:quinol monooxygenase YgiN|nr:antibiotic biosynthesis monooxygenase [Prevotellaceae bacterium]
MKKVLSFVLIASVMLFAYSCNCGSKDKKCDKAESGSCCKEGQHKVEVKKIVITAELNIKTDQIEKFLTEVQEIIAKSKAEEGNASYNLFADLNEKNKFIFVEEWKGQAAVDTHFATEHFKKFNTLMDEVAASPAKIKIFEVINEK